MAKPKVTVTDRNTPLRAAIAQRIKTPFGRADTAIPLKEPRKWKQRAFDRRFMANRFSEATHKGWMPLEVADLAGDPEDYGWRVDNGRLVRGDRGEEWLGKMLMSEWRLVEQAKTESNIRQTFGIKQTKQAILDRSSAEQGDEATSFLAKSLARMEVTDKLEQALDED
mgnify:CR=1 FL=1